MTTKIPQNIDKEDKLVGPLTLKQFLYLLGGSAVTFLVYQYYVIGYLFFTEVVIISLVVMLFAAMLAFGKVNGRPFITFLANVGNFIVTPKHRLWHKENTAETTTTKLSRSAKPRSTTATKAVNKSQLEQLATILDTGGKMEAAELAATHEINNLIAKPATPEIKEHDLGVEDVLSDTES
ncbi:PrgI family protein [Patescibacteria group bacterium]|nr:PrgI family protein [Patescibacteria group bacterium]